MNHLKDSEETRNKIHYAYVLVEEWLRLREKSKKNLKKFLNNNEKKSKEDEWLAELKIGVGAYIYDLDKPACLNIRYYSDALMNEFGSPLSFDECKRKKCKEKISNMKKYFDITEEHMICRKELVNHFIDKIKKGSSEQDIFDFLNKNLRICTIKKEEEKKLPKNRQGLRNWKKYYNDAGINPRPAINNK
ncbi:MAG: hypothetical protein VB017_07770 [Endomicrobiaceae bacterium]|nr:hypothetical protein [Endomicrobiaceae bacterium]